MSAWDRQTKPHPETGKPWLEPPKAYEHFCTYRDLGPSRTLEKTGTLRGVKLSTLLEISAEWTWVARCDQWDAHVKAIHDRAFLDEAAKRGRQRVQAFSALLGKALEALRHVDTEKVPLQAIAAAMKTATEGLRLEEGLETSRVAMEVQDVRVILARLPAAVRGPLARALAEWGADEGAGAGDRTGIPLGLGARDGAE